MITKEMAALRKREGYTQIDIMKKTGISRAGIISIERGYHSPTIDKVEKYLNALGYCLKVEKVENEKGG